jgi:hypothetical protein
MPLAGGWHLILMQSLATGFGYAFFFRLQQVGGPIYLSRISYVNTAVVGRVRRIIVRRTFERIDLARDGTCLCQRRAGQSDTGQERVRSL